MSSKKSKARRPKMTPITDISGADCLLSGRIACLCEAERHELLANCLNCGRIVCAQEGWGTCFTCNEPVLQKQAKDVKSGPTHALTRETQLNSDDSPHEPQSQTSSTTANSGLKNIAASLEKAVTHKNKMLEYDRNSSVRTNVIDDENDYFSLPSQNWITNEKRRELTAKVETLHENKHKTNKKVVIDLLERSATEHSEPIVANFNEEVQRLHQQSGLKSEYESVNASNFINSDNELPILFYIADKTTKNNSKHKTNSDSSQVISPFIELRIQDKELMIMRDEGMCLSVNQPFASLLVSGIKRFEGRQWYTAFRGKLWIHASSKNADNKTIEDVENFYRYSGVTKFPPHYPTSALIGCVSLTDCLPFEEFKELYPNGEVEDNYVFVCDDAMEMQKSFPMSGKNKLFKLDNFILKAAHNSLI